MFLLSLLIHPIQAEAIPGGVRGDEFVRRAGPELRLNGKLFRYAGANNYYPMYKSQAMVDYLLGTAAANGYNVMRIWGSLEIGNQDGSTSVDGIKEGVYFQYGDGSKPAYNDGPDGLRRLDYVVYRAGQLGIRLVIPFVNNWNAFGGMDQYVRWRGGQYHDQFYTDPTIRSWYKSWIGHLLNRTNVYTGVRYKDDPTIMIWELANEPRCLSAGAYPRSDACTTATITAWADDVSRFIKSIDPHHLVGTGDEGFYCIPGAADWTENCGEGVDTLALTRLPHIDVMSLHLYPDHWSKDPAWGTEWIARHTRDARALRKPAILGEFGLQDKRIRNPVYKAWTDTVYANGGSGASFWILSDKQDDGSLYPDFDGFTVYCPSPVCTTLSNFARMMAGQGSSFAPVADDDTAVVEFNTSATLDPPANDVAYDGAAIVPGSIDLDPALAGRQTERAIAGQGTFVLQPDYTTRFTPAAGFVGRAAISYTVQDSVGRLSNQAQLAVTVKPDPTAAIMLFSFETGTEGWAPGSWQPNAGSVAQSPDFHTDGTQGLQISSSGGGAWFGLSFGQPVDLSSKSRLKIDIQTLAAGTSRSVALQLGDSFQWCQTAFGWINAGTTTTIDVDLIQDLGCSAPELNKVQGIFVWFSTGTFYVDAVRAE
jgi:mannan endo-1,4-beta-mannosidase